MNKTVLVVGSGPIIIGQAAEFDYAGAQACKSLREEGYRVVLINSNPATIMTDSVTADNIYLKPLTKKIYNKTTKGHREKICKRREGCTPTTKRFKRANGKSKR